MLSRRRAFKILGGLITGIAVTPVVKADEKAQKSTIIHEIHIAGFNYYQDRAILNNAQVGDVLTLEREPQNQYDTKAIIVYRDHKKLGYIPRANNRAMSKLLDTGMVLTARIAWINKEHYEPIGIAVELWA